MIEHNLGKYPGTFPAADCSHFTGSCKAFVMKTMIILCFLSIFTRTGTLAQIPVIREPRHKLGLENEYIRLFDVHIAPGDTTLYHIHSNPSVMIIATDSRIGTQVMHKQASGPVEVHPGETSYADYGMHPLTHRVWNQGTDTFHVFDMELLRKASAADTCPRLYERNVRFDWEQKLVRVYHIALSSGQEYDLQASNCAHLLVVIRGHVFTVPDKRSLQSASQIKPGGYFWYPPQSTAFVTATSDATCVLLELK